MMTNNNTRMRYWLQLAIALLLSVEVNAQARDADIGSLVHRNVKSLEQEFARHKKIPLRFEEPILAALSHFPELKDVSIKFIIKRTRTPLSTRPTYLSMILPRGMRSYIVTISDKTIDTLSHLLYNNLSFEERVGIMGHELSHVADFNSKTFFQSVVNLVGHLSPKYIDDMEFNTDRICIEHGLGRYLEIYSLHVRKAMHVHNWRGVDYVFDNDQKHERYMNPRTIEKYLRLKRSASR